MHIKDTMTSHSFLATQLPKQINNEQPTGSNTCFKESKKSSMGFAFPQELNSLPEKPTSNLFKMKIVT